MYALREGRDFHSPVLRFNMSFPWNHFQGELFIRQLLGNHTHFEATVDWHYAVLWEYVIWRRFLAWYVILFCNVDIYIFEI